MTTPTKSSISTKELATVITAITALVAGIGGVIKPQDQTATKATYEVLAKAIQDNSKAIADQHDELVRLKQQCLAKPVATTTSEPQPNLVMVSSSYIKVPDGGLGDVDLSGFEVTKVGDAGVLKVTPKQPVHHHHHEPAVTLDAGVPLAAVVDKERPLVWLAPSFDKVIAKRENP